MTSRPIKLIILTTFVLAAFAATACAKRLSVAAGTGNIRSGPGTKYDTMWQVERYHPLETIEKSGKWYRFRDFENDQGWIHESLVGTTPTIITRRPENNIRSGPGTNHKVLFTVEKGVPFKVLKRDGKWIHVEHADKDKGWVHQSMVW